MHHFSCSHQTHSHGRPLYGMAGYFMGRRRGSHPFGRFARGLPGLMGMGGGAFRAGRRLGSGDLQLLLLALLAEKPSHGYELIKALEERSNGFYVPSPGMVYPALAWLEEMDYAAVTTEGTRKLYTITEAGRDFLKENGDAAKAMLGQLAQFGRGMSRIREAFEGLEEEDEADPHEIHAARRNLRNALRETRHASGDDRRRIAAILNAAATQIRGKS